MFNLLLVVFLSALGAFGDYLIALAGKGEKYVDFKLLIAGAITYVLLSLGWFFAMKNMKLSDLGVIYSTTTLLLLVFIGVVFFKEKLMWTEVLGVALAIASIFLVSRFH